MSVLQLLLNYGQFLLNCCLKGVLSVSVNRNMLFLNTRSVCVSIICKFLKNHTNTQYKTLIDIVVIDYPLKKKRFEIIYVLLSTNKNSRIFIKTRVASLEPIMSITGIYSGASWFEREAWDMFGIFFINNFDLRRILTDYGFLRRYTQIDWHLITDYVEFIFSSIRWSWLSLNHMTNILVRCRLTSLYFED